jgi:hypothetical protein
MWKGRHVASADECISYCFWSIGWSENDNRFWIYRSWILV